MSIIWSIFKIGSHIFILSGEGLSGEGGPGEGWSGEGWSREGLNLHTHNRNSPIQHNLWRHASGKLVTVELRLAHRHPSVPVPKMLLYAQEIMYELSVSYSFFALIILYANTSRKFKEPT